MTTPRSKSPRQNKTPRSKTPKQPAKGLKRESVGNAVRPPRASTSPKTEADTVVVPGSLLRAPWFPIVGIGASAGGLAALESFLKNVPQQSGMAVVIVQHMDPAHDSGATVELLQRSCAIPVAQLRDKQKLAPDRVYVLPPNKDLSIFHGVAHLLPPTTRPGLALPIDYFFRALAQDQGERSIGVILSGMGTDGTLGLRAIKEKEGATFVQSLSSARFDGMPRSAIEAGLADVVAPAGEIPSRILAYVHHTPHVSRQESTLEEKQRGDLDRLFALLRTQTGNDFSLYKKSTVCRRIERRMGLHQIGKVSAYVRLLRENPQEIDLLFKELLIGVTSFFRDPVAWDHLRDQVLPDLIRARAAFGVLRAWVPGCSTGEEAYSLAIVLKEAIEATKPQRSIAFQIFATDLDRDAIDKARQGAYPSNIEADVSPERLQRFFTQDERGYRIRKEIRESVIFAPQNIAMDPPFTKLDLLSCRNLLIYLSADLQKKIVPLFHYSLNPGGVLLLGTAETVGAFHTLFSSIDGTARLYRRADVPTGAQLIEFPAALALHAGALTSELNAEQPGAAIAAGANLQTLVDRVIVQRFAPAVILTTERGDILYISARTGKYLEPSVGRASMNVFAMAREGLGYELSAAFASALREDRPVTIRGVQVRTNGSSHAIDVTVQRLTEPKDLRGTVIIVFTDVPMAEPVVQAAKRRASGGSPRVEELEKEVQQARDEVRTTREEMQRSQEELKSINEELQSTNEELQSTNEELTTSKEEMQSMNEELQTVNYELQGKVDELSRSNNDMKNLLNSTDIATLFLDGDLLVRRFTRQTAKIIKLIPGDTGRPITDIASDLDYADLADDAREVLRTLVFKEKQVGSRGGRWFTVRIMPYRTLDNVIDGIVITFSDSTASKALERALEEGEHLVRELSEAMDMVLGYRADGACDYVSRAWLRYTGVLEPEQAGFGWVEQVHPDDREQLREAWRASIKGSERLRMTVRVRSSDGAFEWFRMNAAPVRNIKGDIVRWLGSFTNVDELQRSSEQSQRAAAALSSLLGGMSDAVLMVGAGGELEQVSARAEKLLGRQAGELLGKPLDQAFPNASDALSSRIADVMKGRQPAAFEASFEGTRSTPSYVIRVLPHAQGASIFVRPTDG